ncbi:hypothetical protein F5Y07DRAFT_378817 [Xylaria sp. FL0933]|nr:hypothetical protein F5Y07DRAFT_378817 [Xylaria sp. FL0933]
MDSGDTINPTYLLDAARIIPIAELCPDLPEPSTKAVGGVVTITWPYNKVKGTFAFNLAEPDFRLRRNKGQVRVEFTDRAARAVGDCGLGGNDEVLLSLEGATWEAEAVDRRRSLPGADIGWRLVFSERVSLKIKRAETNETDLVIVRDRPNEPEAVPDSAPTQPLAITKSPSPSAPVSPIHRTSVEQEIQASNFNDDEFASPAFVKRARMSYGALFEDGFDIFQDDDGVEGVKGKRRRRTTQFARHRTSWRYASRSASPESVAASSENDDIQTTPTKAPGSANKVQMADEGCQTMELDRPSPHPISTVSESQIVGIGSENVPMDEAPDETPIDSAKDQQVSMPSSNAWFRELAEQSRPALNSKDNSYTDTDAPPRPGEKLDSSDYSFPGNAWNMSIMPSTFQPQQAVPIPALHESFGSADFRNPPSSHPSIPFSGPDSSGDTYSGNDESQEPVDDVAVRSVEPHRTGVEYPQLEPDEDARSQSIHDEALVNYPAGYLEGDHMSQHSQIMPTQRPSYPEVPQLGSSSWATVNHSSTATAVVPTDRLGSKDGDTPEQAVVIDESDEDSDSSPEPMAVEDTVNSGRAYALDMYEDAEAEDEVDAQYSDDDEPEYDADEMGGDYDTRNYEQPGDDDEGSLDERPQPLEPEFDDGESWDEEEQEEFLDDENEGEYEMDEDIARPAFQPAVRANPMVIDLISSSEDESEDENDGEADGNSAKIDQSGAHTDSRIPPIDQQMILEDNPRQAHLNDEGSDIISQAAMSEAEESSEAGEERADFMGSYGDDESEFKDDDEYEGDDSENEKETRTSSAGNETSLRLNDGKEIREPGLSRGQAKQQLEPEINSEAEAGSKCDAAPRRTQDHADVFQGQMSPVPELHENSGTEISNQALEEDSTVPLSAADGLEILSRAVDEWSDARSRKAIAESAGSVVETISDKHEPPKEDTQLLGSSSNQQNLILEAQTDEDEKVDSPASSKPYTRSPLPASIKKEPMVAVPSSPPLSQSFRSLVEDSTSIFEEEATKKTAQATTAQLPTPHNTQLTDIALNISSTTASMNIVESFESHTTIEQVYQTTEDSVVEKSAEDFAMQSSPVHMDQDSIEQERDSALSLKIQAQQPSNEPYTSPSPARSFQTQTGETELAFSGSVEEKDNGSQLPRRASSQSSSSTSDDSRSFASHMEVDEELQASILEDSLLEDYSNQDDLNDHDDSFQIDTTETYIEPEETGHANPLSPLYEDTPAKQLAEEISAQLKRNFMTDGSGEESDTSMRNDPSVHLARVANASKRRKKRKRATSTDSYRPRKRLFDTRRSPTPETDDSSLQLAREALASQTPKSQIEGKSMASVKLNLARHLSDELPDCTSLKVLRQHLTKSLDVIAVAVMQPPEPRRAKGRPREYMMSFTIADYSIGPYAVAEVLIYRPHKDSLPVIRYGDIVLLRNFTVVSLANKGFGLKSNDGSSWAVFDFEGEPPQIKGPPVEYGVKEILYVSYLREWFELLDDKARQKLELANQKIINTGKPNLVDTP